jgi:hypothetical protein
LAFAPDRERYINIDELLAVPAVDVEDIFTNPLVVALPNHVLLEVETFKGTSKNRFLPG